MKKKHIYFNLSDKPANMGQSQLTDDLPAFLKERKDLLPNAKVEGNKLTFDVTEDGETRRGFAMIQDVGDDFQN